MSFPSSPTNGQQATVNNTTYVYNSAQNTWSVVATTPYFTNLSVTGNITSGNLSITNSAVANAYYSNYYLYSNGTPYASSSYGNMQVGYYLNSNVITSTLSLPGNVIANAIYANTYYFANGTPFTSSSYGNTQVAAYLSTYSGNLSSGNTTITGNLTVSGNANVASYFVAGNLITYNGIYFPNGKTAGGGYTFWTGNTSPSNANTGDTWYQGNTDILFEYVQDGAGNRIWVDILSGPSSFGNLLVANTLTVGNNISISGNITATGNITVGNIVTTNGIYYPNGATAGGGASGGANTMIQFSNAGVFGGATYLQYNYVSGNLVSNSATTSTSTTTGALVLSGGVGIGGNLFVGGNLSIAGNTTFINTQTITTTDTIAAPTINAGTIGNSGAIHTGSTGTFTGLFTASNLNLSLTTASTVTAVLTRGSDNNFQLTAQNGSSSNQTGAETARFGINYSGSGWDSFIQFIRGSSSQNGALGLWAANTAVANVASTAIYPVSNNSITLGTSSSYWSNVYAANGTFLTSLGVGTNSPLYTLDVKGPSNEYRTAIFESASNLGPSVQIKGSKIYELRSTDTGASEGAGLFFIYDKDNNTSRLTVNSSGLIGIGGVTSPTAQLDVNGNITARTANVYAAYVVANSGLSGTLITNAQTNITSVGTLTSLTVNSGLTSVAQSFNSNPASIDAGRIFAIYNTNYMPGASYSSGDSRIIDFGVTTGNIAYMRHAGSNGLQWYVGGNGTSFNNALLPTSNASINIGGTGSNYWSTVYAVSFVGTSTTAKYADLAEMYHADDYYTPGTVMVFGGDLDVTVSTQSHDTAVAGVVSTNPAYLMNDNFESDNWLPIALTGRVPCLVRGPVNKGTLLVSSNESGVACALDKSLYEPGCVIGKSMDIILDNSVRKIEIAVGRF